MYLLIHRFMPPAVNRRSYSNLLCLPFIWILLEAHPGHFQGPMFTIPKIMEMESPSAGTLVHIFASVRGENRRSGRKRLRNDVEPHRLRRTQEGDQLLKGILALLPASPQNAHQNLLGSCAVPGPVAAPGFPGLNKTALLESGKRSGNHLPNGPDSGG